MPIEQFSTKKGNEMTFKHELGQLVQVTISGEEGHIKGRAEYTNTCNVYMVHYRAADGRAVCSWFDEDELSPTKLD